MIVNLFRFAPLILFVIIIVTMLFYKLDKQYDSIMNDLMEREARGEM